MFSKKVWLCCCALLAGTSVESWSDECQLEEFRKRIKECFKNGMVVNRETFKCLEVNSKGGCGEGERLVLREDSDCKASKCLANKDREGNPCPEGSLAYKGSCKLRDSKTACKDAGLGKRLQADLYGEVSCRCAADLGYVDVDGECYHEYQRGPCNYGKQLVRDGTLGGKCRTDTCGQGEKIA